MVAVWTASGLPQPGAWCRVDQFEVKTPNDQGYWNLCSSDPKKSFGCMHMASVGRPLKPEHVPYVVIAPWYHSEPTIVVHELLHAFQRCNGVWDAQHQNPQVWEAAGGATSVQTRAVGALTTGGWL